MSYSEDFKNYLIHEKRFSTHTVVAYMKDLRLILKRGVSGVLIGWWTHWMVRVNSLIVTVILR